MNSQVNFFKATVIKKFNILREKWFAVDLVFNLLKRSKEWRDSSLKNYAIFFYGGTVWLALIRFFQMWITNSWNYMPIFYSGILFSILFSSLAVALKYFTLRGFFRRSEENKIKRDRYMEIVSEKNNLRWNILFSKCLLFLMVLYSIFIIWSNIDPEFPDTRLGVFAIFFLSVLFILYVTNHFYVCYCISKTKKPDDLLREPPKWFIRLTYLKPVDRMLIRRYGTMPRTRRARVFFEVNKERLLVIGLGIGSTVTTAIVSDNFYSAISGRVGLLPRLYTFSSFGWYTPDLKTKRYAHQLSWWGIDPTQFKVGDSNLLNEELVKEAYKAENSRRYPKPPLPIPAELAELVEKAELRMLEQEKRHSLQIEKLNNEMKKLKNQAVSLENSKEIDLN